MTCTTPDCGNPTDLYLCRDCVRDLQAWIDKARELLPDLEVTILRLDNVRRRSEGGNGGKSGSAAPLNLAAWQIRENIASIDRPATQYAHDKHAAGITALIREWVTKAELHISGPETETPINTEQARARLAQDVPRSLGVPAIIEWLQTVHGITLKPSRVWKWAERGHITRTNETGRPQYDPVAVLITARKEAL